MSAELTTNNESKNKSLTHSLRLNLESMDMVFESVQGMDKGSEEFSFIVFGVNESSLVDLLDLAKLYRQESILLVKTQDNARAELHYTSGQVESIGTFQRVNSVEGLDAYTMMDDNSLWAVL